ncbi:Aldo/keto reductase [Trichodelitschia bisporula]|uniref:Aldo/keto reductase n=1 Tax=Trichodelitschia bisporula TaxID=703511 RepID=A0A6G1HN40_9PEZI|nr:Aldo/keto reductase [Trichodelitschia bisporula]
MHPPILLALASLGSAQFHTPWSLISPPSGPHTDPPKLGFGTWMLDEPANATEAVASAIELGYRHIDCATAYQNQEAVGKGIAEGLRRTGLRREDLWVTSKLWSTRHGALVPSGLALNLKQLGLEYLDLTLMHFPVGTTNGNKSEYDIIPTWKEMEKIVSAKNAPEAGKTRFIGISNFNVTQLEDLLKAASIKPKVHQFELHPYLQQTPFLALHRTHNITVTAYAPLGDTNPAYRPGGMSGGRYTSASSAHLPQPLLTHPTLLSIGAARGCTPAQVSLAWNMARGVIVHPRAKRVDHQKENLQAFRCPLQREDVDRVNAIEREVVYRMWDPCPSTWGVPCYLGLGGGNEAITLGLRRG